VARRHIKTEYLDIDTAKCTACGKCIEECSNQVLKAAKPEECIGCLSCVEACSESAIREIA
jgi:NAD-dependent dihydropyrimidine dehydrogenase PreA subunit